MLLEIELQEHKKVNKQNNKDGYKHTGNVYGLVLFTSVKHVIFDGQLFNIIVEIIPCIWNQWVTSKHLININQPTIKSLI